MFLQAYPLNYYPNHSHKFYYNHQPKKQATYCGTSAYDQILQLEIGKFGNVYVVGQSEGNLPTKGVVYSNNNGKQFVSKFKPDLSELLINSVYGSGGDDPDITINAFLVDDCNKIYVRGWGSNSD